MKILVFLGFLITVNTVPTLAQQTETDSLTVSFEVVVPEIASNNDPTIQSIFLSPQPA